MGNRVEAVYDVGVAGLHRLLEYRKKLAEARVIVCVAGMEGALPSVVAGMVAAPVIAVPTSTGYGSSFGGLTALLGMLNSCASNVSVVNIDNGFGAGCVASAINRLDLREKVQKTLRRGRREDRDFLGQRGGKSGSEFVFFFGRNGAEVEDQMVVLDAGDDRGGERCRGAAERVCAGALQSCGGMIAAWMMAMRDGG